eukprot:365023-Chlamydomonas_euryale.AAC.34
MGQGAAFHTATPQPTLRRDRLVNIGVWASPQPAQHSQYSHIELIKDGGVGLPHHTASLSTARIFA